MSLLNQDSNRSSKPVFPYAVPPEKEPFFSRIRRGLIIAAILILVVGASGAAIVLLA